MPINIVILTTEELARTAIDGARELSAQITKLADLEVSPLAPGETIDTRRHKIASLGLKLAHAFKALDAAMRAELEAQGLGEPAPAPTSQPTEVDPNAN